MLGVSHREARCPEKRCAAGRAAALAHGNRGGPRVASSKNRLTPLPTSRILYVLYIPDGIVQAVGASGREPVGLFSSTQASVSGARREVDMNAGSPCQGRRVV